MDDPRDRLRIVLRPSRILVLTLGCGYVGAAACVLALDFAAGAKSLMIAFLVFSALCDLRCYAGLDERRRIREIIFHSSDDWIAISGAGRVFHGRPGWGRLVHPLAVCFSLEQSDGKKLPVLILCDMCDIEALRDLRVWLRGHPGGGGDPAEHRVLAPGGSPLGRYARDIRLSNGSRS